MPSVTIADIDKRLRHLPPDKLIVVYDFVSYLLERDLTDLLLDADIDAGATMLGSEAVLRRDWDRPEEDVLTAIDSFDYEILRTRKNAALMALLDERANEPATMDLATLKAELGID
ncbi:hypothetical protein EYB53_019115 [Candidatus Chloroploca sp. M-50]|uniref:DUF2281 domain-containing protein n=1 Tax=Candidatus Chloroploca mongolica TaxID=2528176 RepID=A0ABS4DER0_9CHLR|nr:hypothetical protein [Candidatus Chloroploca mongolica]MBP1467834.1 hypothetical protein [Candidatus Chloroploca mongolica]